MSFIIPCSDRAERDLLLEGAVHLKKPEPILGNALGDESLQTPIEPAVLNDRLGHEIP
jgi:hypothetical protein